MHGCHKSVTKFYMYVGFLHPKSVSMQSHTNNLKAMSTLAKKSVCNNEVLGSQQLQTPELLYIHNQNLHQKIRIRLNLTKRECCLWINYKAFLVMISWSQCESCISNLTITRIGLL